MPSVAILWDENHRQKMGGEMMKNVSVKKRIDVLLRALKVLKSRVPGDGVWQRRKKTKTAKRLAGRLVRASDIAFEKAGLDVDKNEDWKILAVFLSAAAFGARGPGHPKKWTKKKLRRLLADFGNIHAKHPDFSEERCCKELIQESGGQYNKVDNAKTLRRVLQTAKRQESLSRQIDSLESGEVFAGVSKLTKKR